MLGAAWSRRIRHGEDMGWEDWGPEQGMEEDSTPPGLSALAQPLGAGGYSWRSKEKMRGRDCYGDAKISW